MSEPAPGSLAEVVEEAVWHLRVNKQAYLAGRLEELFSAPPHVTPAMLAAAWGAWHARHEARGTSPKIGPGPAFKEAIEAALAAMDGRR